MKVGDSVTHVDYPGRTGRVVAATKKWPGQMQTFFVKWEGAVAVSRHIEAALNVVKPGGEN